MSIFHCRQLSRRLDVKFLPLLLAAMGPLLLIIAISGLPRLALTLPQLIVVMLLLIIAAQLFLIASLLLAIVLNERRRSPPPNSGNSRLVAR